jgi:starch synthase
MKILMVCAEFAPWAKTGGLADAVAGLSAALAAAGHDVRVLLPRYAHVEPRGDPLTFEALGRRFTVAWLEPQHPAKRTQREAPGPHIACLELEELTGDAIYLNDDRDAGRFIRLAAAAAAMSAADGWRPDVVHCHDWHAALVPVLMRLVPASRAPSVLTLHNAGYQGVFADGALAPHGLAAFEPALPADARAGGTVNFMRAGIRTADRLTTVSPTYAEEIKGPELGMGLDDVLRARGGELIGILNGVDYDVWSPERDPFLPVHYDAGDLAPKRRIKGLLLARLGMPLDIAAPLIGVVSRLVAQKGIDLLAAALPSLLADTNAGFVVLGSGDAGVAAELRRLAALHPGRVEFKEGYEEELSHLIFAGADLTVIPSRYEPCGLTQLYALRYGTVPVVRATGGLADTIRHFDPETGSGNGSVFLHADPGGVAWGVRTALGWYADAAVWSRLVRNGMAEDFSWPRQVPHYEVLYRSLL